MPAAAALCSYRGHEPSSPTEEKEVRLRERRRWPVGESLKVNGSAAFPDKGRNSGVVASMKTMASNSMAFPAKSCDNLVLYCMLCGITATSQENMQDHLKGKIHIKKTSKLTQSLPKEVRRMG
ncbi:hypothetical protein ZWY2020_006054 [Hordeum vulgare]|nr:hypothetical protein ZWY2020_006054 [Hordeum vulgare]